MGKQIVTRIAPSPTGPLHIGLARTALFNYLYAKKNAGKFIIRIEDTDKKRSKTEYETDILEGLNWLGLVYDEINRQSERTKLYKAALEKLIASELAYVAKGEEVVRLKSKGGEVIFTDLVRGEISTDVTELGDFIIARSLDDPLYHLAVVVDDESMGVTHVIRGEDHISNTATRIRPRRGNQLVDMSDIIRLY